MGKHRRYGAVVKRWGPLVLQRHLLTRIENGDFFGTNGVGRRESDTGIPLKESGDVNLDSLSRSGEGEKPSKMAAGGAQGDARRVNSAPGRSRPGCLVCARGELVRSLGKRQSRSRATSTRVPFRSAVAPEWRPIAVA